MPSSLAWPVAAVVVAIVGAVTYLAANGHMAAADVTTLFVLSLGALGITTTAHVTANAVVSAQTPTPAPAPNPPLV